jgi:hypothetical protein
MRRYVGLFLLALVFAVLPLAAQENTLNTVNFNGFQFKYPADFATSLQISHVVPLEELEPPLPPDTEPPSYVMPPHIEFFLTTNTPNQSHAFSPADRVRVFHIADMDGYSSYYPETVTALQKLLGEQPDLTTMEFLPVLHLSTPGLFAQQAYVETETLRGIRYISEFSPLAVMSIGPGTFVYTFQAISKDGQYYVTADFHLNLPSIPTPTDSNVPDPIDDYYANIETLLNAAQPADFTPNLAVIEAIFASMELN